MTDRDRIIIVWLSALVFVVFGMVVGAGIDLATDMALRGVEL